MGDPKKGQSSRVRLYRITRMSWFRGDIMRGGTSAIPRQGGSWVGVSLFHPFPVGLISTCFLPIAAFLAPHLPLHHVAPLRSLEG